MRSRLRNVLPVYEFSQGCLGKLYREIKLLRPILNSPCAVPLMLRGTFNQVLSYGMGFPHLSWRGLFVNI